MKNLILTLTVILFFAINHFSQNVRYEMHGAYQRAVKKETLNKAKFLSDIVPDYPSSWITEYDSVEIEITAGGKKTNIRSRNNILTQAQKNALNNIDIADYVAIKVFYKYNNEIIGQTERRKLHVLFRVVPEVEAQFMGGSQQFDAYIKSKGINKVDERISKQFSDITINFTVSERGEIIDVSIYKTSGSGKVDKLFLDAIKAMPNWKPAENANGKKVKQEFEFTVNSGVDGC